MAERPAESKWLYNQPASGIVENWFKRNEAQIRSNWIDPKILDTAFILMDTLPLMDGNPESVRYKTDDVSMVRGGPDVPRENSELWHLWQEYSNSEEGKKDFNGSKLHLHSFSRPLTDSGLMLQVSDYDWHRMRVLGLGLANGSVPEHYRDGILPSHTKNGFEFLGEHPNNTVIQGIVITSDNHLVMTTSAASADYHAGTVSPSFAEQMNGQKDNSPFETYLRAVATSPKLKVGGEELRLNIAPETLRMVSMILEPDFNAVGFIVLGKCQEESGQIDASKIGVDSAEFNPARPIWTASLSSPEQLIQEFFNPQGFHWHGVGRARIATALAYTHGYEETMDRLYKASSKT